MDKGETLNSHSLWSWHTAGGSNASWWSVWLGLGVSPSGKNWQAGSAQTQSTSIARACGKLGSSHGTLARHTPDPEEAGIGRCWAGSPEGAVPSRSQTRRDLHQSLPLPPPLAASLCLAVASAPSCRTRLGPRWKSCRRPHLLSPSSSYRRRHTTRFGGNNTSQIIGLLAIIVY